MFSSISTRLRRSLLALTSITSLALCGHAQGEDLGEVLEHVKWKGIIGSWMDAETKGERVQTVYTWKFENKLVEVNSTMGETKTVFLMGFNPDTEEVFMMGGNNKGGANLGTWVMDGEDAVLNLSYVRADGEKGKMRLKHHWVNDDTIEVSGTTEEGGNEFTITLIRTQ